MTVVKKENQHQSDTRNPYQVSVIMPAFNSTTTLVQSIESVMNQTYDNLELIVVDDASSDDTSEILNRISKRYSEKMRVISNNINLGAALSRNLAIEQSKGQLIAFLDSDDIWFPEKIEKQVLELRKTGHKVCHTSYFRENIKTKRRTFVAAKPMVTYQDMLKENLIGNLTGLYDTNEFGVYYQKSVGHEDYEMWLRILQKSSSVGLAEPHAAYRYGKPSLSSSSLRSIFWHFMVLKGQPEMTYLRCFKFLLAYIWNVVKKRTFLRTK